MNVQKRTCAIPGKVATVDNVHTCTASTGPQGSIIVIMKTPLNYASDNRRPISQQAG